MNVAQLIKALQEIPNHSATVTVTDAAGTNLVSVNTSGATQATPASEGPQSNNRTPSPGTVQLVGGA